MSRPSNTTVAAISLAAVAALVVAVFVIVAISPSCGRGGALAVAPPGPSGKRTADKTYTVRGRVMSLPTAGKPTSQLVIRHEPIDDFENPAGSRGMASMDMPFVTARGVSLDGLAVGDAVEFDLAVWHAADAQGRRMIESSRVTRVKKLPADTKLREGAATPMLGG